MSAVDVRRFEDEFFVGHRAGTNYIVGVSLKCRRDRMLAVFFVVVVCWALAVVQCVRHCGVIVLSGPEIL